MNRGAHDQANLTPVQAITALIDQKKAARDRAQEQLAAAEHDCQTLVELLRKNLVAIATGSIAARLTTIQCWALWRELDTVYQEPLDAATYERLAELERQVAENTGALVLFVDLKNVSGDTKGALRLGRLTGPFTVDPTGNYLTLPVRLWTGGVAGVTDERATVRCCDDPFFANVAMAQFALPMWRQLVFEASEGEADPSFRLVIGEQAIQAWAEQHALTPLVGALMTALTALEERSPPHRHTC